MTWEKTQIRQGDELQVQPHICHLCSIPSLHLFNVTSCVASRGCGSPASMQHLFPGHVLIHIHDNTADRYQNRPSEKGPSHPCLSHQHCAARGKGLSQANPLELGQRQKPFLPRVLGTEDTS